MLIKEFVSKDFPTLSPSSSARQARAIAEEFGYTHVFIKENGVYIGACRKELLDNEPASTLGALEIHYEKFAVLEDANLLDTIKLFHIFGTNVVPVISAEEEYLGYICCDDVFGEFSKFPLFSENGAILTIQTGSRNVSFTEISKIVEGNGARIYGIYISGINGNTTDITLKISSDNLSSIDETFERYGYTVVEKHYTDEKEDLMRDRFSFFQKFLEY